MKWETPVGLSCRSSPVLASGSRESTGRTDLCALLPDLAIADHYVSARSHRGCNLLVLRLAALHRRDRWDKAEHSAGAAPRGADLLTVLARHRRCLATPGRSAAAPAADAGQCTHPLSLQFYTVQHIYSKHIYFSQTGRLLIAITHLLSSTILLPVTTAADT